MITNQLMEHILERDNCRAAYERVMRNKGAAGVDGMTVEDFHAYLKAHWTVIRAQLLAGTYKPQPVRRVSIPKPQGGTRELGIPTLTDRLIQQAILQVLTPIFDPTFSERSYGFRPKRSAHQAVTQARGYIDEGYTTVVDLDLEKFFDTVHHDRLMATLAKTIEDKRVLALVRRYLQAGIMAEGVRVTTTVGTPQGGPLSPLLANIVLDELDRELERRGHHFVRYADDCNIYVKTPRAGTRVKESITRFIEKKLRLKVNETKSAVAAPNKRQFLGFTFYRKNGATRITLAQKTKKRLTKTVKALTKRSSSCSMEERIDRINRYLTGWLNYFAIADASTFLAETEAHLRRRLRMDLWKQWKRWSARKRNLERLGCPPETARQYAGTHHGCWRIAGSWVLTTTLTNQHFRDRGLLPLVETYQRLCGERTAGYGPVRPVV